MKKSNIWPIINSNFFIWLMGFIFLYCFPYINQVWKSNLERNEKIHRIDNELSGRFDQLVNIANRLADSAALAKAKVKAKSIIYSFLRAPSDTTQPRFFPIYQEFNNYGTVTLMSEEGTLIHDNVEKLKIRDVINKTGAYVNIPLDDEVNPDTVKQIINRFREPYRMPRWEK